MDDDIARTFSAAFTEDIDGELTGHLIREDAQEDLCFALYHPSTGAKRFSAIVFKVLLPEGADRQVHGTASFNPTYFERALDEALSNDCGIALLHTHPGASGWQSLSLLDHEAEFGLSRAVSAATGLPLLGLTLSGRTKFWSARLWNRTEHNDYKPFDCEVVRVVGKFLRLSYCPKLRPNFEFGDQLDRTIHAWGHELQQTVSKLRIGIVGLGSVGQMVAEALARIGVSNVTYIDFDIIENVNRDRTLHAYHEHARMRIPKVVLAAEASGRSSTAPDIEITHVTKGINKTDGYRAALDCDVLFSCVDRPLARSILNFISYAHLIPVIDGGIDCTQVTSGAIRSADWGAFTVGPQRRCLACHKQYDPAHVSLERDGSLDDPSYISSLPPDSPLRKSANVFPFSMALAALEVQKLIQLVAELSLASPDEERYSFPSSIANARTYQGCESNCSFAKLPGQGDSAGDPGIEP